MLAATLALAIASGPPAPAPAPVELGNRALIRHIEFFPWLRTTELHNQLSGRRRVLSSEEFRLRVDGLAEPLRSRDFALAAAPSLSRADTVQSLRVALRHPATGIEVEVRYTLADDAFWTGKSLLIRSPGHRIDEVEVEHFRLDGPRPAATPDPPPLGWPLFIASELFVGLAWPAAHNRIEADGTIALRYFPGRSATIETHEAVIGVAPDRVNDRVRDRFFAYIDAVRARPVKYFHVWDTYHNDGEDAVRERFEVASEVFAKRGVKIDAALMDGGWTEPQSVMKVARERPGRPALVSALAQRKLGSRLGLHVITSGVRATVDHAWLAQHYEMLNPVAYCLADPRVAEEQQQTLLEYARSLDVAAFKFDWANFNCDRPDHRGHRGGLDYGREAITAAYARSLVSLRAEQPDSFLYDAGWDSPWWLRFEDAVFSGEGDYNTTLSGPPSLSQNDLETTWRDGVLAKFFRDRETPFPLSSLMNHGPVNWGWDNWFNKPDNPLDRFTDELLMNYLRGTQLIEYCLNLSALGDAQRDALARVASWALASDDVLLADTRFVLGDPRRAEVYGYSHFAADGRGLIGIRNPAIQPATARLRLDELAGMREDAGPCWVTVVYPYLFTLPDPLRHGQTLELPVDSWETLVVSVLPAHSLRTPLPLAVRYEIATTTASTQSYRILGGAASPLGVSFSDGQLRAPRAAPPGSAAAVLSAPPMTVAEVAVRVMDPGTIKASFRLDRPRADPARLVAIQHVAAPAEQGAIGFELRSNGQKAELGRTINSSRAPDRAGPPGWVMADAWLPPGGTSELTVLAKADPRSMAFLAALPFDCGPPCRPQPGRPHPFELWLLSDRALDASEPIEVPRSPAGHDLPAGLPAHAQRRARAAQRLGGLEQGVASLTMPRAVYAQDVGAMPWLDREYRIRRLPRELAGLPALRRGHELGKVDASLRLKALAPLRIYAAFGAPRADDQWLDPPPGWSLFRAGALDVGIPDVPGDIHVADFPAGELALFDGQAGNWLLLGITAPSGAH